MKRGMSFLASLIAGTVTICGAGSVLAGGVSSSGFRGVSSADDSALTWDGYRVANKTAADHSVTGSLGIWGVQQGNSFSTTIYGFHGHGTQNLTCWLTATNVTTGATYANSAIRATYGAFSMTLSVTPPTGTYAFGAFCYLPAWLNGTAWHEVWGAS